jgi:parvulin-like peptidyl-prolyl isomerase
MRKLIREPLFHFLLLGAVIFFIADRSRSIAVPSGKKIVVTQSQIESIVVGFSRTWMRPPTREELQGLVNDYVRDEVLYREARTMGLDQDDVIVRRRMRQKFEFLVEDVAARTDPPSDQELEAYLKQHVDKYSQEPSFRFEQIFFSREKRGASAEAEALAILARLRGTSAIDIEKLGDAFLMPSQFEKTSAGETARLFGEKFANELTKTQLGTWAGPIESSYGLHLVRVNARIPEVDPPLAKVRESVLRDLLSDRRKQELDTQYEKLRAHYTVVLQSPEASRVADAR